MSNQEKSDIDKSRDIISQLKELQHNAKNNIEKLGEIWIQLDTELKQKENAELLENLINQQNTFHDSLDSMVSDYEIECNRIENEGS